MSIPLFGDLGDPTLRLLIKILYKRLFEDLITKQTNYSEKKLTVFSSSSGSAYNGNLMIVGRAVNKWKHNLDINSDLSWQTCALSIENALETENLNWVKEEWGSYEGYNTKKSAFWRLTNLIAREINSTIEFPIDSIVWTNLYKASNESGGNPSSKLIKVQLDTCRQILDAEIDYYKPKLIIFLTGLNWAQNFLIGSMIDEKISNMNFVQRVGTYRGSQYIVGQHPQGKSELLQLNEIMTHLSF